MTDDRKKMDKPDDRDARLVQRRDFLLLLAGSAAVAAGCGSSDPVTGPTTPSSSSGASGS